MSLINDALRRAREAQDKAPPPDPATPRLRPLEPTPTIRRGVGLLVPVVLSLVALTGLFFLWQLASGDKLDQTANPTFHRTRSVVQRAVTPPATVSAAVTTAPVPTAEPVHAAEPTAKPSPPAPMATTPGTNAPAIAAVKQTNATAGLVATSSAATHLSALPTPPPPKPAPLRLQAIVFQPLRPSAMISGKTLHVGDRIGEFHVLAIDRENVTLAGGSRTNVLSLAE